MRIIERFLALSLFLLLATCAIIVSVYKPYYNWDIIGYIASAKSFEQQDIELLHSFTYDQLRNSLSAEKYEELTQENGSGYRHSISTDPSAFKEQLPFYQIRPVYTGMIYLLYKIGVNIVLATHLISGFAVVVAIAFLYLMSVSFLPKPFIYAIPPLAVIFGVLNLARYSTPDGLAFLAVIVSVYLYLKARFNLLLILLPIVVGIRTDFILFVIPLLFFIFALNKCNVWKTALSTFMSVAIYFGVGAYWGYPGWSTTFYFTLIQILTHPISMPPKLTVKDYFHILFIQSRILILYNEVFILYMIIAAYSLFLIKINAKTKSVLITFKSSPSAVLAVVCLFFVVSHFLTFPVAWIRFFSAPYLIGAFSLLSMVTDYLKSSQSA
jgi:hypothetical protein